ncbi:delta fatty acid desaturase [Prauserella marina]|uniref:Fatty acid desaturase n=1 Tax=Prauserella marina TaxID=530584 RepID=A0A222VKV7_9PSEU|nr:acyl-CoA desaturase [Prauserella marina]ASR34462.1 delta fatty acid desaturase [Prauserella marina]PWV85950.1 fatty acid desaturase [Prauserella marina]SDC41595.1 Fatty acid desaturase [Prauserella marina]
METDTSTQAASGALTRQQRHISTYSALSRKVRQEGLLRRRYGFYWTRIVAVVTAFALVWITVLLLGDTWWQLVPAAALAMVSAQFGFLGHDLAHHQVFASTRWNVWSARVVSGLFAGLSYLWWKGKHNKHHNAPNQEDRDPDIGPGVLAFTPAEAARRSGFVARFTRHQGWAFFPLLTLEGLQLHVASVRTLLRHKMDRYRWVELSFIIARLGGYVAVLLALLPVGKAAAFAGLQLALFGVLLGGAFAPNHKGMPIVPAGMKVDFLRRQVMMSRNIRGNAVTDFMMGGLNRQIEHHLFPSMPRPNLKRARPLVRAHCAEHDVPYTETSLWRSYRIVVRYLNAVGLRARDPFQCPLIQRYRA